MKGLALIFFAHVLVVCGVSADFEPGLKVKFDFGFLPWQGLEYFYDIPRKISVAIEKGWQLTERPEGHRPTLVAYCPNAEDPILCGLYDGETGIIGGLQICLPELEVKNTVYDWKIQGFTKFTTTTQGEPIDYQCTAQFFVSEEYLKKPLEERLASRTTDKILQEDKIWLTGFNGKLDEWSDKTSDLENSIWTKQACIPWMGQHWYYNMSSTTLCGSDTQYPWFPLVDSGRMIAIGFVMAGTLPTKANRTYVFETPPQTAVKLIVRDGPQCLYDLAKRPGLLTMHTYFVNKPWTIGCPIFG